MFKFKYFSQFALIQAVIIFLSITLKAQDRAVWVTAWDMNSPEKIDAMVTKMQSYGFNKIFIQTRYRGDALYFPNKVDSTYINDESRCYLLKDKKFDPLSYTIEKAKPFGIGVYAWVTTFVITPHDLRKIDSCHVYFQHPDWLLKDKKGNSISFDKYEGAFLDPALPEVRKYTLDILSDIVTNYEIAGIQLDYIRYPDTIFGWNFYSLKLADSLPNFNFSAWKQQKISSFVNQTFITLKNINPNLEISAAVISNREKANDSYSQQWWNWLEEGFIDRVYVMAYNTSNRTFTELISELKKIPQQDKLTIIIRSWKENKPYHYSLINTKINILKAAGFENFGFYNYNGLVTEKYLDHIKF